MARGCMALYQTLYRLSSALLLLSFSGLCVLLLLLSSCSRWSFLDVPLILFCQADHIHTYLLAGLATTYYITESG